MFCVKTSDGRTPARKQAGFSMLEVMVAILIFSFGMLALAGLQLSGFKFQAAAGTRASVASVSADIAERLRTNIPGAIAGNYLYQLPYAAAKSDNPAVVNCGAACSSAQTAQNDLANWVIFAQTTLPGGAVNLRGTTGTGFTSTVMWFDKEMAVAGSNPTTYEQSAICTPATTGVDARNCCPANTPAGIRCINTPFLP
jgi:type IV pilus assembly protein PilV